jgi:hypothetical protein
MNNNKIFKHNLNNESKIIRFKTKKTEIGNNKYLPSFSKEWINTIYSFDKNTLSNLPSFTDTINKILKTYFNLFFKNHRDIGLFTYVMLKRRRNFLRRIFISNAEVKHTNDKMLITFYTINREKNKLKKRYFKINKIINKHILEKFFTLYYSKMRNINNNLKYFLHIDYDSKKYGLKTKRTFLQHKLNSLSKFNVWKFNHMKKVWVYLIRNYLIKYMWLLRKYTLLYSLNQSKFNKLTFLSILSGILKKILPKKVEYNIVNLKYATNSPDIFTDIVALKLKRKKISRLREMSRILNRTRIPQVNRIKERTFIKRSSDSYLNKYRDLKLISNLKNNNLDNLLNNTHKNSNIYNDLYNSIRYKNIGGIRIEVKGRLTKRYRADRSIYSLRWKGGLKNIDSSFQRMNTVLFRGNVNSNLDYGISTSKRRIGAFAVKGWIAGK